MIGKYDSEDIRTADFRATPDGEWPEIFDSFPAAIACKDRGNRFRYVNRTLCDRLGIPPDDLVGRTEEVFLPREQAEMIWAHEREVVESGHPRTNIVWPVEYQGRQIWVQIDIFPSCDAQGNVNGTIGCGTDITALKKSQEALMVGYRQEARRRRELEEQVKQLQAREAETGNPESPLQICPVCKKIHSGGGRYIALESYFQDHLGMESSPGFCPECAEKVHREIQPQRPTCQECGSDLDVMRYTVGGRHFRRYSCPACGYSRDYVRERREKANE